MAGYSGTPLVKKLGIKPGHASYIFQPPPRYFEWMHPMPEAVSVKEKLCSGLDFIHLFVKDQKTLQQMFVTARKNLKKDGMLWISWQKKSSKVSTDLDENIIRNYGLKEGLVDVKVCAIDEIWSRLKFVFRLKDR